MKYLAYFPRLAAAVSACSGCDLPANLFQPNQVKVVMTNNADFRVNVEIFIHDQQEIPKAILIEIGQHSEFSLAPGETTSFSRDCEDLQAIVIDNAELMIVGQIGPEAETDVLRDGDDFGCGDTIDFTFDHSPVIVDFDIFTAVR
jgi:hypothetical protein